VIFGPRAGEYVVERDGSVLVFVPPGESVMGSEEGDDRERPPHPVQLSGYFIGKHEVTIEQFGAFVKAAGHVTTAEKKGASLFLTDVGERELPCQAAWSAPDGRAPAHGDHPVAHVSWFDASAYAVWAGLALPTEAQWEKAAAWDPVAKRSRRYAWGDVAANAASPKVGNVLDETFKKHWPNVACFDGYEDGYERVSPVGSFPDGASCYGALDMTGNVAEWCADAYEEGFYARSPHVDPVCTQGAQMVIRGGSFSYGPKSCRAARRGASDPERTGENLGFRVALSAR
jgi:formylglycine-generating enzyme required for sulfatase activity